MAPSSGSIRLSPKWALLITLLALSLRLRKKTLSFEVTVFIILSAFRISGTVRSRDIVNCEVKSSLILVKNHNFQKSFFRIFITFYRSNFRKESFWPNLKNKTKCLKLKWIEVSCKLFFSAKIFILSLGMTCLITPLLSSSQILTFSLF